MRLIDARTAIICAYSSIAQSAVQYCKKWMSRILFLYFLKVGPVKPNFPVVTHLVNCGVYFQFYRCNCSLRSKAIVVVRRKKFFVYTLLLNANGLYGFWTVITKAEHCCLQEWLWRFYLSTQNFQPAPGLRCHPHAFSYC